MQPLGSVRTKSTGLQASTTESNVLCIMLKTCFFISRIGDTGSPERDFSDKLLKYIIAPVLKKCGYETPIRADHITQPGVITTQVFTHLWNDDLVIADLTGSNPNVFYELAVRHIRRKPFVHLIQAGHKIPFDIAPNRTIEFDFDIEKAELAKQALEGMVNGVGDGPLTLQTPLSAAIDFSAATVSENPVQDGIAQILSLVQEIRGRLEATHETMDSMEISRTIYVSRLSDGYLLTVLGKRGNRSVKKFAAVDELRSQLAMLMGEEKAGKVIEGLGNGDRRIKVVHGRGVFGVMVLPAGE